MLYLAADHGGFELKNHLKQFLEARGYQIEDLGPHTLEPLDDYPDYAFEAAKKITSDQDKAILVCRTGQGMAIAANRYAHIRAAVALSEEIVHRSREDENTNVIVMAADYTDQELAQRIALAFIEGPFTGQERHRRRIGKISRVGVKP